MDVKYRIPLGRIQASAQTAGLYHRESSRLQSKGCLNMQLWQTSLSTCCLVNLVIELSNLTNQKGWMMTPTVLILPHPHRKRQQCSLQEQTASTSAKFTSFPTRACGGRAREQPKYVRQWHQQVERTSSPDVIAMSRGRVIKKPFHWMTDFDTWNTF